MCSKVSTSTFRKANLFPSWAHRVRESPLYSIYWVFWIVTTRGEYYLNGTLIKNLSETKAAEYRNRMIGFIFQSFNLISFKNAVENVALPLFYQGVSRRKRNALALEYLDRLGLKEWAHHMPNEMSGGQKQRVAIARALITQPQIILADEPTGNLDSKNERMIFEELKKLTELGKGVLVVSHNDAVTDFADRICVMKDGILEEN